MKKYRRLAGRLAAAALALLFALSAAAFTGPSGSWSGLRTVLAGRECTVGLRWDGSVLYAGANDSSAEIKALKNWKNVIQIELAFQDEYLVGYTAEGAVMLAPLDEYCQWSQADVSGWKGIQDLLVQYDKLAGLRTDGTVLLKSASGPAPDVSSWKDVKELYFFGDTLLGLKTDGTVVATDYAWLENSGSILPDWANLTCLIPYYGMVGLMADGQMIGRRGLGPEEEAWSGIKEVYIALDSIFGLRSNGTVAADLGYPDHPALKEIAAWRNIVALGLDGSSEAPRYLPLGLCADGTVKAVTEADGQRYGEWNVSGWSGVKQLYSGANYTIGLRYDGTLLATGGEFGTADFVSELGSWRDIVALSVYDSFEAGHVVGLRRDGTAIAAGYNGEGQCSLSVR